jgi:hypothetical protein
MNEEFFIDPKNKFSSLTELIEFYQKNPAGTLFIFFYLKFFILKSNLRFSKQV